jgi:hypothetical protein
MTDDTSTDDTSRPEGVEFLADETAVISVPDDESLQALVGELFPSLFGIDLSPVPDDDALVAETEVGTLFVGVLSDFVISLELRLHGTFRPTLELLTYLNEENAGSAFVNFSTLDECLWVSGNVDGRPLVPLHLARVLTYMFQAAAAVTSDVMPDGT